MFEFFRKWYVVLAVIFGVYLAIPKPVEPVITFGKVEYLPEGTKLKSTDGKEFSLITNWNLKFEDGKLRVPFGFTDQGLGSTDDKSDAAKDKKPEHYLVEMTDELAAQAKVVEGSGKFGFAFPLARFRMNQGQDLAGGSTLRYVVRSASEAKAEQRLRNMYLAWKNRGVQPLEGSQPQIAAAIKGFSATGELPAFGDATVTALKDANFLGTTELEDFRSALTTYSEAVRQSTAQDLVGPTIERLNNRLSASGMLELNIIKAGKNEIEIKLPSLSGAESERIKDTLQSTGALEFLILPKDDVFGSKTAKDVYPATPDRNPGWYAWYDVLPSQTAASRFQAGKLELDVASGVYKEKGEKPTDASFNTKLAVVTDRLSPVVKFVDNDGNERKAQVYIESCLVQVEYIDPNADDTNPNKRLDGYPISGDYLGNAEISSDKTGRPAVSFTLKGRGVSVMSTVTGRHNTNTNDPRLLAVAIDQKLYSAASINDRLSDQIQVSGSFTRAEVQQYVDTLKSGSLPVTLALAGEESVGPAEGADNIERGITSIIIGAVLVLLFALFFYRAVGVLTMANIVLTIVLILAIMALFLSTITLPGIAGLVLTMGMAIDGNILINERIKEERLAGASAKQALDAGFSKAFSAIMDGNLTTLLTAVILAKVSTGAVAGFAVTLSIGIIATLFTNVLVYRTTFSWLFDRGILKEVRGPAFLKDTNFNFYGVGKKVFVVSLLLTFGLFGVFIADAMDGHVFGIDFRGGTQVVMQLKESKTREDLEKTFATVEGGKYANVQLQARSYQGDERDGTRWELRFPLRSEDEGRPAEQVNAEITAVLTKTFEKELADVGFHTFVDDVTKASLEFQFTARRPKDIEVDNARHWLGEGVEGWTDPATDNWFAKDLPGSKLAPLKAVTATDGKTQVVTFTLNDVNLSATDNRQARIAAFHKVLKAKLWDGPGGASATIVEPVDGGFPPASGVKLIERNGSVKANVILERPVKVSDFSSAMQVAAGATNDRVVTNTVSVTPLDAKDEMAKQFSIESQSGDFIYDEAGNNLSLVALGTLQAAIEKYFESRNVENHISSPLPKVAAIGGRVATETQVRALGALLLSLIGVVIYIWIRFRNWTWGLAAVTVLVLDLLLTLGAVGVADKFTTFELKIDLNAIAALLTVVGYSLNDTIIIFDRVREELVLDLEKKRRRPIEEVLNAATNLTLSRTVLTSTSTIIVVIAMMIFGGPALQTFSWTLFLGLFFGTFTSLFRSGPNLMFFNRGRDLRADVMAEEEARKEAERAEAEALAAISTDREVEGEENGDGKAPAPAAS